MIVYLNPRHTDQTTSWVGQVRDVGSFDVRTFKQVFDGLPEGWHVYLLDPGDGGNNEGCSLHLPSEDAARAAFFAANIGDRDVRLTFLYVSDELHEWFRRRVSSQ